MAGSGVRNWKGTGWRAEQGKPFNGSGSSDVSGSGASGAVSSGNGTSEEVLQQASDPDNKRSELSPTLTSSSSSAKEGQTAAEGTRAEAGAGGEAERGVEEKEKEEKESAGKVAPDDSSSASQPIRLDWVKPVTQKEKDEEDKTKVAAGVCDKIQSYAKLYGEGLIAWQPQADKYVLMDCHRNQDPLSHLTVEQTGRCVARKMIRSGNLTTLFLATDTNDEEVNELEKIMRTYIPNLRLVRQPMFLTGEDWAALLAQANFTHMFTVQAMLDKVICAMADVFSGTDASSFSLDITRIRAGLRFQVCDDAPICHGQALVGER
ncbi:unnamed protein product [Closterium sp. Yama58-4]|nr:unnamed protein product [Closterium sp. Yama58-4]